MKSLNCMSRNKREAENLKKFAIQDFAKHLLDVADNMERALFCCKNDHLKIEQPEDDASDQYKCQLLVKESPPKTVLILTKPNSASVQILCSQMVRWLKEQKKLNILVEPRVRSELLQDSSFYDFVKTWQDDNEVLLLHTKVYSLGSINV